jgi:hypothetical protein
MTITSLAHYKLAVYVRVKGTETYNRMGNVVVSLKLQSVTAETARREIGDPSGLSITHEGTGPFRKELLDVATDTGTRLKIVKGSTIYPEGAEFIVRASKIHTSPRPHGSVQIFLQSDGARKCGIDAPS